MLSLVMVQVLAASATLRLATTAMNVSEVPKAQARFFEDHFAQQLSLQEGLKVTTPSDAVWTAGAAVMEANQYPGFMVGNGWSSTAPATDVYLDWMTICP